MNAMYDMAYELYSRSCYLRYLTHKHLLEAIWRIREVETVCGGSFEPLGRADAVVQYPAWHETMCMQSSSSTATCQQCIRRKRGGLDGGYLSRMEMPLFCGVRPQNSWLSPKNFLLMAVPGDVRDMIETLVSFDDGLNALRCLLDKQR